MPRSPIRAWSFLDILMPQKKNNDRPSSPSADSGQVKPVFLGAGPEIPFDFAFLCERKKAVFPLYLFSLLRPSIKACFFFLGAAIEFFILSLTQKLRLFLCVTLPLWFSSD